MRRSVRTLACLSIPLGLLIVGLAPLSSQAAGGAQTFYFTDAYRMRTETGNQSFSFPVGHTVGFVVGAGGATGENTAYWSYKLTQAATVKPVHSVLTLHPTQPTVTGPVGASIVGYCPVYLEVGVSGKYYWYYCITDVDTLVAGNDMDLDLSWGGDLSSQQANAGDTIYATVWNMGSSTTAEPTLFAIAGNGHPAYQTFSGTNEPVKATTTASTAQPSASAPTGAPPTSAPATSAPPTTVPPATSAAPSSHAAPSSPAAPVAKVGGNAPATTAAKKSSAAGVPVALVALAALTAGAAFVASRRRKD